MLNKIKNQLNFPLNKSDFNADSHALLVVTEAAEAPVGEQSAQRKSKNVVLKHPTDMAKGHQDG